MKKHYKYGLKIVFMLLLLVCCYSCDKEVSVTPPDEPVPTGALAISSDPKGALIYLNNKNTGRYTPDSLNWLKGGDYTITLKMPLYRDTTFLLSAKDSVKKSIYVDYFSNPLMYGSILCSSEPSNSSIYLNGKDIGQKTPFTINNLIPGSYTIKFRHSECRDDSVSVIVESSYIKSAYKELADTSVWVTYNTSNSPIPRNSLTAIISDREDAQWIGTDGGGLVYKNADTWKTYNIQNSPIASNYITAIVQENSTPTKWIGTNNGLCMLSTSGWTVWNTSNSILPDNYVTAISIDSKGVIWVGTFKGLVRIQGLSWTLYNTSNSKIPGNGIQALSCDAQSRLWAGVAGIGVTSYDGSQWTTYTRETHNLPGNDVTALSVGMYGEGVWAGFSPNLKNGLPGGVAVLVNYAWHNMTSGLPSNYINSILVRNNVRWVCTTEGLLKFQDINSFIAMNTGNTRMPSNQVKAITLDYKGQLWMTTNAGLVKYKMGK